MEVRRNSYHKKQPRCLISRPSDSLLQSLTIPTPNQMIPQSQTIEPISDETAFDSLNQESKTTETHDIAHHPIPTIAQAFESKSQEQIGSTPSQTTSHNLPQPPSIAKPDNWNQMSTKAQQKWRQRQKHKNKWGTEFFGPNGTIEDRASPKISHK